MSTDLSAKKKVNAFLYKYYLKLHKVPRMRITLDKKKRIGNRPSFWSGVCMCVLQMIYND